MATATNSRIFGAIHGSTVHAAQPNYTSAGVTGRLYVANQQAYAVTPALADTQWINGIDESRFTWYIAYLVTDDEGNPQLNTKIGTQTSAPPQGSPGALGSENNAYIRFKGGDTNDAFIAAITDIKEQNEAAGNVLNNGSFPGEGATADTWKSWADANLDYHTNFNYVAATTTTTAAVSYNYIYGTICSTTTQVQIRTTRPLIEWTAPATYNVTNGIMSATVAELFPEGDKIVNVIGESNVTNYSAEGANQITYNTAPPTATCNENP